MSKGVEVEIVKFNGTNLGSWTSKNFHVRFKMTFR